MQVKTSWVQPVIGQPEVAGHGMCGIEQGRGERLRRHEPPILDDREDVDILRSAGHESERQQRRTADDGKRVALAVCRELIGEGVKETIGGCGTIYRGVGHLDLGCYTSQHIRSSMSSGHPIPLSAPKDAGRVSVHLVEQYADVRCWLDQVVAVPAAVAVAPVERPDAALDRVADRKSTRLNSSH